MKKFALMLFAAFMAAGFTACSDDDNKGEATETVSGFYTINAGNKGAKIPSSITAFDYATGLSSNPMEDAFYAVNEIALGDNAQQALVYGDKMYIVMHGSNLIWVVDPVTLKIISSIKPEGDATQPRYIVGKDDKLYCTMYTGYVSEIDPESNKIIRSIKVGPNPDQLGVIGNNLVVACSDGSNYNGAASNGVAYGNSCISIVDLSTFEASVLEGLDKVLDKTQAASLNPTVVASNGTDAFVVSMGDYTSATSNTVLKVSENKVERVCEGSIITVDGNDLYVIKAQYGVSSDKFTYKVYDTKSLKEKRDIANQNTVADAKISYPSCVAVDPVDKNIVIVSYNLDSKGYPQYKEPTYANIYDWSGNFKKRIQCGVGATSVTFIHEKIAK